MKIFKTKTFEQVHLLEYYVPKIQEKRKQQGLNTGLGFFSEQSMEDSHYDFNTEWEKVIQILYLYYIYLTYVQVKVPINHPNYSQKLFSTITRYNAKHAQIYKR